MRFFSPATKLIALGLLLALSATLSYSTTLPVRGASHYGLDPGFASCSTSTIGNNCQSVNPVPTIVSFNGLTYNVYQYAINDGTNPEVTYDVIDLGSIGANTTFSLPSIFIPALTEIFGCGGQSTPLDGSAGATDSSFPANPINAPCTAFTAAAGLPSIAITENADGSFTTGASFSIFNLVLDSPISGPVSTPEPASLMLLGVGLVAVARKFRRAS